MTKNRRILEKTRGFLGSTVEVRLSKDARFLHRLAFSKARPLADPSKLLHVAGLGLTFIGLWLQEHPGLPDSTEGSAGNMATPLRHLGAVFSAVSPSTPESGGRENDATL